MKQTIFLVAGCPSTDLHAAHFIRRLKSLNPNVEYRFIGVGGKEMQQEGFESVGVNSSQFLYKPFFPFKNFRWIYSEAYIHPVHAYTHIKNLQVLRQLQPKLDGIFQQNPLAFVTFENQFFMKRFYQRVQKKAAQLGVVTPPTFYWGLTHTNENHDHQQWLDHFFIRAPIQPKNWAKFDFPHTQVGWEGLFRAYRFLFSRSEKYKGLTEQADHLFLPAPEHRIPLADVIGELVLGERALFRPLHNIGEQDTVLFLAPGNTEKEVKFALKLAQQGIKQFLNFDDMKNIPKESITLIISVPPQLKEKTESLIKSQSWPVKVVQVNDELSKFQAIAASDIGLAINGQIVAELAGLQLPTIVLDAEPFLKSYYRSLWNGFCVELNLAIKGEAYPELLGSSMPMNVALHIQEIYKDPKLRYWYVGRYHELLQKSLCPASAKPTQSQVNQFPSTNLVGFKSGNLAMAEAVQAAIEKYRSIQSSPVPKQQEARVKAFQELGRAKGL